MARRYSAISGQSCTYQVLPSHGPWRGLDALEYATLSWVDWYNHHRLFSTIGYVPPAEYEAALDRETVPARAGTQ